MSGCCMAAQNGTPYAMDNEIRFLKCVEYHSRYGDYFAREFDPIRDAMKDHGEKSTDAEPVATMWAESIVVEERQVKLMFSGADPVTQKDKIEASAFHRELDKVANSMPMPLDSIKDTILKYSERNKIMHAELSDNINHKRWHKLGTRCTEDLRGIRLVFDSVLQVDRVNTLETLVTG